MSSTKPVALPAFVVRHLDAIARAEGFHKYTVDNKAGSKNGDGFMSNMLSITLREEHENDHEGSIKQLALICKLQLPNPETDGAVNSAPLFEREVEMYKTILPIMESLQHDHGLSEGFFAYPKCFVAEHADNHESIIILEDLRVRDFAMWDKLQQFPFENVALLMTQLGRYHALSFVLRDQKPEVFAKLEALDDIFQTVLLQNKLMRTMFISSIEQAESLLEAEIDKQLMRSLRSQWDELVNTRKHADRIRRFGVLIHGDLHTNNVMFHATNVCIVYPLSMFHEL